MSPWANHPAGLCARGVAALAPSQSSLLEILWSSVNEVWPRDEEEEEEESYAEQIIASFSKLLT